VAGVPVSSWADMTRELGARPGERVEIGLLRGDANLTRIVVLDDVEGERPGERRGMLGILQPPPPLRTVSLGPGEAVAFGAARTTEVTTAILRFLRDLVTLNESPRSVGSIGTIWAFSGAAAAGGLSTFLGFMAFFSINLAILNMLPIPPLDGGHMVFLGIEFVRGRSWGQAARALGADRLLCDRRNHGLGPGERLAPLLRALAFRSASVQVPDPAREHRMAPHQGTGRQVQKSDSWRGPARSRSFARSNTGVGRSGSATSTNPLKPLCANTRAAAALASRGVFDSSDR